LAFRNSNAAHASAEIGRRETLITRVPRPAQYDGSPLLHMERGVHTPFTTHSNDYT